MTESSFRKAVERQLPREIKKWKVIDAAYGGVSDTVYFGINGKLLFVEWKFNPGLPVRPTTIVAKTKLPPLQHEWFKDLYGRQVPVCAIVGTGEPRKYTGVVLLTPEEAKAGIAKYEFLDRAKTAKELATHISQAVL